MASVGPKLTTADKFPLTASTSTAAPAQPPTASLVFRMRTSSPSYTFRTYPTPSTAVRPMSSCALHWL
jgi:hypothetical protein